MTDKLFARTVLVALLTLGLVSCGCPDDEISAKDACSRLTETFEQALTGCGMDASYASYLCFASCRRGCVETAHVESCSDAIRALGCDQLISVAIESLGSCSEAMEQIEDDSACSYDDDDDDFFDD